VTLRIAPSTPLIAAQTPHDATWAEYLQNRISTDWRRDEFDVDRLLYVPKIGDPTVMLRRCDRLGCDVVLDRAKICPQCLGDWQAARSDGVDYETWAGTPRVKAAAAPVRTCDVPGCLRSHATLGLCSSHRASFDHFRRRHHEVTTVADWLRVRQPAPFAARERCLVPDCWRDRAMGNGLCITHHPTFRSWLAAEKEKVGGEAVATWIARMPEPLLDPATGQTYGEVAATPFGLLPQPLRWEFLYAVQQRDLRNNAMIAPVEVRATYAQLRRLGWTSAVGKLKDARVARADRSLRSMIAEWHRIIDAAHREWSGVDDRDPKIIFISELPLRHTKRVGPNSTMNLQGIELPWIVETVAAWARGAPRAAHELHLAAAAWTLVDEVLRARGTQREDLSVLDMDAVFSAARLKAPVAVKRVLLPIRRISQWARGEPSLQRYWADIPAGFMIDPIRHPAQGERPAGSRGVDESFRFVPQPIIDWLMDRLHLVKRYDAYSTAEARALIYVHERSGRRTGETVSLKDDCISYDSEGAPYLEWRQGKPPYAMGKRLPIHQETHDVIRQWQQIKRDQGKESEWLFPSPARRRRDAPTGSEALRLAVRLLIAAVTEHAPFPGPAEGADGNLVHFDLATIDPYAFRHAFAQRLADATDADGRQTTPPDVLQEMMGHKNFNTTMAYYEVTAKRRKKVMSALPSRRLDLRGQVVTIDRERDSFTRVAVTLGHCTEPQNVATGGHGCVIDHACESCPFFLVDPLERDGMAAKRDALMVKLERARVITAPQHLLDHYEARIKDTTKIIDGIDAYLAGLPRGERERLHAALDHMSDIRRRATAARRIDLRALLKDDREGTEHG